MTLPEIEFGKGFWRITAGNIIAALVSIGVIIYEAGQINERFSQKIDSLIEWKKLIENKVDHMDEVGTKSMNAFAVRETDKQLEQDRRLTNAETQLDHVVPDVREVKTKIDLLTNYLEDGSPRKKL